MTRNRLLILVSVLLIILIGISVYVFAILVPNAAGQSGTANLNPTATTAVAPQTKQRSVVGVIQSLSSQSLVITLTRNSKTMTIDVTAQTKYSNAKSVSTSIASFSDLKVGQTINVRGRSDPQDNTVITATSIVVKTAP